MSINEERGNFSGVRVLELGQGVAAPYCGMLLAQNGATVTKVEPIDGGDWSRKLGQSYGEFSANALVANWGKKSLALDLKSEQGQAIVQKLAREADVIVENYRPGVTKRLKLDYESIVQHNKTVVYASLTGFGNVGPNKDLPGTDTVMQGYTGIMSINQDATGFPRRLDMLAVDVPAGLYLFQAVSAALYKRATQGIGSRISTSLLHCSLAFQQAKMIEFALTGSSSEVLGAPIGTFRTADGFLSLNARRDPHFSSLCQVLDKNWMADERFCNPEARTVNREVLTEYLTPIFVQKTTRQWCELMTKADILHAAVNNYGDLFEDPQVEATGILNWDDVPGIGRVPRVALPGLRGDGESKPAPGVGEHTDQVLKELGYSPEDIERFRSTGVVR